MTTIMRNGFCARQLKLALGAFVLAGLLSGITHAQTPLDVTSATIPELNAAMDAGTLSSELLVSAFMVRMAAYDQQGPALNAIMMVNPKALDRARELDRERAQSGPRSPMHGIPVVIKDNMDTADMPTTAGSVLLEGSIPPDDAHVIAELELKDGLDEVAEDTT